MLSNIRLLSYLSSCVLHFVDIWRCHVFFRVYTLHQLYNTLGASLSCRIGSHSPTYRSLRKRALGGFVHLVVSPATYRISSLLSQRLICMFSVMVMHRRFARVAKFRVDRYKKSDLPLTRLIYLPAHAVSFVLLGRSTSAFVTVPSST